MFYLIDKPAGISSFMVIRKLRKILNIRKIGHTGTLDPFATGCLILATGKSTKLIPLLEATKKEYIATIRFDGITDSFDTETSVNTVDTSQFRWKKKEEIEAFLLSQKKQIPPKYSALHIDGKRSYELARDGVDFDIKERDITVYDATVLSYGEYELTIRLTVSAGTYIRSFGPLLGRLFLSDGGYLTSLRRISIRGTYGQIDLKDCSSLESPLGKSYEVIFHTIHTYIISDILMKDIIDGKSLSINEIGCSLESNASYLFFKNQSSTYVSFCRIEDGKIIIVKNDIE